MKFTIIDLPITFIKEVLKFGLSADQCPVILLQNDHNSPNHSKQNTIGEEKTAEKFDLQSSEWIHFHKTQR